MKKNVFIVLGVVFLLRVLNIIIFNEDPLFYLSPRNFNGRGLLITPNWIDFLIPLLVIVTFWNKKERLTFDYKKTVKYFFIALSIILAPALTGLLLNNYLQKSIVLFEINTSLVLKYLLFIISFIAINVFADNIRFQNKIIKKLVLFIGVLSIAYAQDIFGSANAMYILMALLNSTGLTVVLLSIGLRKYYKRYPLETIFATAIAGVFLVFFIYSGLSVSFFTIFLPFISMLTVAICWYKNWKLRTKLIVGSVPFILAIFLNYALPEFLPSEIVNEIVERKDEENFIIKKYKDITVKYKDPVLKQIALNLASVIHEANYVAKKELGVSPEVKELVITGIGPGGFHAEFPNRIVGRIISEKYLQNCYDSSFLNNPELSPDFPDPVNAILHEYSHLFGTVPYHKWYPGPEEEGWATYSATRLSKLLYKENKNLWKPSYNYEVQAEKITKLNLSGKAVAWSHPNEFGGFNLWYNLGKQLGLSSLYHQRWNVSKHDLKNGSLFYISNPEFARKAVETFGKENFLKYGKFKPVRFGEIYSEKTYLYLAETSGIDTSKILRLYGFMKDKIIDPSVPLPD